MQSQQKPSSNDFKRQRCVVAAERPRQRLGERPSHALAILDEFAHGAQAALIEGGANGGELRLPQGVAACLQKGVGRAAHGLLQRVAEAKGQASQRSCGGGGCGGCSADRCGGRGGGCGGGCRSGGDNSWLVYVCRHLARVTP